MHERVTVPRRRTGLATAFAGLALVTTFVLAALIAPLLTSFSPTAQLDPVAGRYLQPGASRFILRLGDGETVMARSVRPVPTGIEIQRDGRSELLSRDRLRGPIPRHPHRFILGTDRYGRDVWSRLLYGARISLTVGLLAAALAASIGSLVGAAAASSARWLDRILMRTTDGVLAFPRLFLLVAMAAIFPHRAWVVILVIGATGWMGLARIVRGELLSLKQRDFIAAARASGVRKTRIFLRHLLPHVSTPILVEATTKVGETILAEAALSFLGLGIQPPTPSWGSMIAEASEAMTHAWWAAAIPGVALTLCALGFNLLGDGLRDRLEVPGA